MIEYLNPNEIEIRSFEIIKSELPKPIDPILAPIILRVIHTTADFDYADTLTFSPNIVEHTVSVLKNSPLIISDTNMVKAGVDKTRLKALNGDICCFIQDEDVSLDAKRQNTTRARAAVDKAATLEKPIIFVVGNAPTALLRICELKNAGKLSPALVIGVPVGFVNVIESKEALINSDIPYITALGRKGGSNVAAAICNALLRIC